MSNCSNHKKELFGQTDMKHLAEDIGNLHYESLYLLFYHLSQKLDKDSITDYKAGRDKLASALQYVGMSVFESALRMKKVWDLCEPFMLNKEQEVQASVARDSDSSTSDGKQNNLSNSVEDQIQKQFAEKGNQLKDVVGVLADEKLWEQQQVTGELYRWVKASEKPSQHYVNVCCRLIGEDFWFTAYYDWSKKMYVPRNFSGSGGYINPKEIEYQVEVEPGQP